MCIRDRVNVDNQEDRENITIIVKKAYEQPVAEPVAEPLAEDEGSHNG